MDIDYRGLRRIAVVRRNRIGDFIMAVPLMGVLRELAPQAQITLMADEHNIQLAPFFSQYFDRVRLFSGRFGRNWENLKTLLNPRRYDLVIIVNDYPSKSMNQFLACTRARYRVAYVQAGGSRAVNCPTLMNDARIPRPYAQRLLYLLMKDNVAEVVARHFPKLTIPTALQGSEDYQRLKAKLAEYQLPVLYVSMSNHRPATRLGVDKLSHILTMCYQHQPFVVLIGGMPQDQSRAEALAAQLTVQPSCIHMTSDLVQGILTMSLATMALLGDSGAMHLASSLQIPQVALFAEYNSPWQPLNPQTLILEHEQDINQIAGDAIIDAMLKLLPVQSNQ